MVSNDSYELLDSNSSSDWNRTTQFFSDLNNEIIRTDKVASDELVLDYGVSEITNSSLNLSIENIGTTPLDWLGGDNTSANSDDKVLDTNSGLTVLDNDDLNDFELTTLSQSDLNNNVLITSVFKTYGDVTKENSISKFGNSDKSINHEIGSDNIIRHGLSQTNGDTEIGFENREHYTYIVLVTLIDIVNGKVITYDKVNGLIETEYTDVTNTQDVVSEILGTQSTRFNMGELNEFKVDSETTVLSSDLKRIHDTQLVKWRYENKLNEITPNWLGGITNFNELPPSKLSKSSGQGNTTNGIIWDSKEYLSGSSILMSLTISGPFSDTPNLIVLGLSDTTNDNGVSTDYLAHMELNTTTVNLVSNGVTQSKLNCNVGDTIYFLYDAISNNAYVFDDANNDWIMVSVPQINKYKIKINLISGASQSSLLDTDYSGVRFWKISPNTTPSDVLSELNLIDDISSEEQIDFS